MGIWWPLNGYWRPLNGFVGVIGMDFLPYQGPSPIFATEPFEVPPAEECWPFSRHDTRGWPPDSSA